MSAGARLSVLSAGSRRSVLAAGSRHLALVAGPAFAALRQSAQGAAGGRFSNWATKAEVT
jgi:hypothetical protein